MEIFKKINPDFVEVKNDLAEELDEALEFCLRYRNDIYKWHQIYFKDGDEILIKTQKIKRYINSSGLLLTGYDRFQTFSKNEPETMKELKDYLENSESNISIKASETCLNKQ